MKLRSYYAVHGTLDRCPVPGKLRQAVSPAVTGYDLQFYEEHAGAWREGRLRSTSVAGFTVIRLTRVFRGELTLPEEASFEWDGAGWEEQLRSGGGGPSCEAVIQHLRRVSQTIYVTPMHGLFGAVKLARICEQLCGCLARETAGLIHVFPGGFFSAKGESLYPCDSKHRLKTE